MRLAFFFGRQFVGQIRRSRHLVLIARWRFAYRADFTPSSCAPAA
ncbi:hypothetical protein CKO_04100 [Citrobacter koseri ATCC BAA-895]|uniref:Uncharacterized protein n=1 Tax=Citrobacter koseri (strain ATCC BAA-895 / CDC 4225-83 / SGSC4696) TaxID=290338 RepID=A8ANV3_CITK8|nr:hypothetical protein CKO_04100 [Citrobacter koseri ATCC BAA-895]